MMGRGLPIVMLTVTLALGNRIAWAQEGGNQNPPSGAAPSTTAQGQTAPSTVNEQGLNQQSTAPATATMPPMSGAEALSPGSSTPARSYLLPALEWTGYGDTNPTSSTGHSNVFLQSTLTGSLTLQEVKEHSQLNLGYSAGAFFYSKSLESSPNSNNITNGSFHELNLTEQVTSRHWSTLLGEQGMYMPESPMGFFGLGGLTSFGSGLGGNYLANSPEISPLLESNQSILTGTGRRFTSMTMSQIEFKPTNRSDFTVTGSFGTLQFLDPGFTDDHYWTFLAGYDHQISPRSEFSVNYIHDLIGFNGTNLAILNRGMMLGFGHQIAGKFSLQLSAGPTLNQIAQPQGSVVTRSFWSTYDSLEYTSLRNSVGLSFTRYITGGSGVVRGAETDLTNVTFGRNFWRRFHTTLNFGHSYNQSLVQEVSTQRRTQYELWQAGATISRELGDHLSVYVNYYAQRQISNLPQCSVESCALVLRRQVGGIGINYHTRPIRIE